MLPVILAIVHGGSKVPKGGGVVEPKDEKESEKGTPEQVKQKQDQEKIN